MCINRKRRGRKLFRSSEDRFLARQNFSILQEVVLGGKKIIPVCAVLPLYSALQ